MKCFVCGRQVEEGSACCTNCGYPMIVPIGGLTGQVEEQMKSSAADYRNKICREIEIGFYAYSHKIETDAQGNEVIKPARRDEIPLGVCGDLQKDVVKWYPEQFVRPHTKNLEYWIYVKRGSQTEGPFRKQIPLPEGNGDIQIGITAVDSGTVKICIGSPSSYSTSEPLDVLAV